MIPRGTTPILSFTCPFDCSEVKILNICFQQDDKIILEKKLSDCTIKEKVITVKLSEEDTLLFSNDHKKKIYMQIRVGIGDDRYTSDIITTSVGVILKDGVLE